RIAEIVDTTRWQHGGRVEPRRQVRDLRIQARIAGQYEQVVGRHVQPGTSGRSAEQRHVESVVYREILQPHKRGAFDPAGRVNGRLVDPGRIAQGRGQEVLVLQRSALRTEHERGTVERVLPDGSPEEEADVELAPIHLAVQADREVRVGIADDGIVVGGRAQRLPVDTSRACCDTGEHLL